jgi:hypothetical protein
MISDKAALLLHSTYAQNNINSPTDARERILISLKKFNLFGFLHDLVPCFTVWFPYLPRLYSVTDNCIKTCIWDKTNLILDF